MRLVEHLPTGVLLLGPEGTIGHANERAHEILGAVLVGREVADVLAPLPELIQRSQGRRAELEKTHPITAATVTLGYQLSELGDGTSVLVFQDISELSRLRAERDRLLQIAAVGEVLPSILHELKNPIAAVRTAVEVLVEEAPDGPLRSDLHAVLGEIRRLALTLEGVGRVRQELRSERHHAIDQACLEAFSVLQPRAVSQGVRMTANVRDLPLLPFDPGGFRAIVFNLVTNALHACRPGCRVELSLELQDGLHLVRRRWVGHDPGGPRPLPRALLHDAPAGQRHRHEPVHVACSVRWRISHRRVRSGEWHSRARHGAARGTRSSRCRELRS